MRNEFDTSLSDYSLKKRPVQEDKLGRTPDEIIRQVTEKFAREMRIIMGSAATAQAPKTTDTRGLKRKSRGSEAGEG